jgi:hypothetical protein
MTNQSFPALLKRARSECFKVSELGPGRLFGKVETSLFIGIAECIIFAAIAISLLFGNLYVRPIFPIFSLLGWPLLLLTSWFSIQATLALGQSVCLEVDLNKISLKVNAPLRKTRSCSLPFSAIKSAAIEQWDCSEKGDSQHRVVLNIEYEAISLHIPVFYSDNDTAASKAFLNQVCQALNIPIATKTPRI